MNDTLWWDGVDGENLVCRPGNENDQEYLLACLIVTRVIPTIWFGCGVCFLYMTWLQLKLTRNVHPDIPNGPNGAPMPQTIGQKPQHGKHGATFALLLGFETLAAAFAFVINGHGTIYPSYTLPGISGDAFLAIYSCSIWYLALIQVQGAKWFKGLVQLPSEDDIMKPKKSCFGLPSVTEVLDAFQGRYGPIIAMTFWILLAFGVISRGYYYFVGHLITASFSLRAFFAFATQRVSALRQVATMQNMVRGTAEDKKRRKGILRSKVFGLVGDLVGVIIMNVLPPCLLAMSAFSSRMMIINLAFVLPIIALGACLLVVSMYAGILKVKSRQRRRQFRSPRSTDVVSQISGGSVLEKSLAALDREQHDAIVGNNREALFDLTSPD